MKRFLLSTFRTRCAQSTLFAPLYPCSMQAHKAPPPGALACMHWLQVVSRILVHAAAAPGGVRDVLAAASASKYFRAQLRLCPVSLDLSTTVAQGPATTTAHAARMIHTLGTQLQGEGIWWGWMGLVLAHVQPSTGAATDTRGR